MTNAVATLTGATPPCGWTGGSVSWVCYSFVPPYRFSCSYRGLSFLISRPLCSVGLPGWHTSKVRTPRRKKVGLSYLFRYSHCSWSTILGICANLVRCCMYECIHLYMDEYDDSSNLSCFCVCVREFWMARLVSEPVATNIETICKTGTSTVYYSST
jgi:hypothetical protein